ncbi:MAG: double-strand break repair protein AddB [Henriciella sp.]|nr:double-strand break repair protein AddB [Henriciella sp.]
MSRRIGGLFDEGAPRLRTIAPGADFLTELAKGLLASLDAASDPTALADALIYVPNRRSARVLAFALHAQSGQEALLLPDIRALGDLETEDPPPSAELALADLPPVVPNGRRLGELTKLVMAFYAARGLSLPAASALSAARELARLVDQAALSGEVDWDALEGLVEDRQLAKHWEQSLDFLKIITQQWPAKLEDVYAMDPYARRLAAAEAMADVWASAPPKGPVIIAGSTGATPASRCLMRAALTLPQGLVVLPGFDRSLPDQVWDTLEATPSHPQFALVRALKSLGLTSDEVAGWPTLDQPEAATARQRLIHEALAPAKHTADWTERLVLLAEERDPTRFVDTALSGLTLLGAKDSSEEAKLAALLMREALETKDNSLALVTPDAGLARQVSAILKQWDVEVPPSAGLPLIQTRSGSYAGLVLDWLTDPGHPVKLMAVLRHALCVLPETEIDALDRFVLRGPRVWHTLDELSAYLDGLQSGEIETYDRPPAAGLSQAKRALDAVMAAVHAMPDIADLLDGEAFFEPACAVMNKLSDPPLPWQGEDGASLSRLMSDLGEITAPMGAQPADVFVELFKAEAAMTSVQLGQAHPRLAIWGPLEARLQAADHIVLAGLVEGVWPAQPPADAFLPRVFREQIGLSDPDERVGLSAHDFAQLACAPHVTLISAARRDDKPAVTSRWIWRLRTLVRGALGDTAERALAPSPDHDPQTWLEALEQIEPLNPKLSVEPRPTPPLEARPTKLSVTRIETLVRDPYAIYCQYVLGLKRLDPLDLPADVRIRGTAVHKALELFERDDQDQSAEALLALIEEALRAGGEAEPDILALRHKRQAVIEDFLNWRAQGADQLSGKALTERYGSAEIEVAGQTFTLSGTADRIEPRHGDRAAILDFKSGTPPSEKQVRSGLSPQMPLLGVIAQEGRFEDLPTGRNVEALTYVQFGTKFEVREIGKPGSKDEKPVGEIIAEARAGLVTLLTAFADPNHPYLSAPRPERVVYPSDYVRLARRDEWAGIDTYD